jgi:hypothetical protein
VPTGGDTIQVDSATASIARIDAASADGRFDEDAVNGEQFSSQSNTVLVHGEDESGKPTTYHECAVDVDFDNEQDVGTSSEQQQQQIEDGWLPSTDDARVCSRCMLSIMNE